MALEVGQVFAGYTVLRVLGAGGMGQVYLATHPRLPREDALKVLPSELTTDAEYRARFVREADLAAGLSHPHIVRIHDRGETDGQFWISMDYVAGTDVGLLARDNYPGGMPLGEVVSIVTAVGSALDYAHRRGLLHRDVKPANILLTDPDGQQARRVFLADFGIARRIDDATGLTATNMTVGTVAYAAPEQLKGETVDGRADQYALACSAFHLLSGAPPYGGSNSAVVIAQHINAPPPSLGAYRAELAGLDPVFARAMAKKPDDRFGTCAEFAAQLGRHLGPEYAQGPAIPFPDTQPALDLTMAAATPPARPIGEPVRRRRRGVLLGALAGVLLLIAGGVFAAVKLSRNQKATGTTHTAAAPGHATPAPNTGPFTGVYRVEFGLPTKYDDDPRSGGKPLTDTYAVRSACGAAGCVATASRLGGDLKLASTSVFDQVGGQWLAVTIGSAQCQGEAAQMWETLTLQPGPDGAFTGEYFGAAANSCQEKRTVTFTRTGDVDINSLPDPATLPPRVVSPAEALHGRYHIKRTFSSTLPQQDAEEAVTTHCLRTGDRCMSYFHSRTTDTPLVFSDGNWTMDLEYQATYPGCTNLYLKTTGQYPLPQPPQNPITVLTGNGHHAQSGNCTVSVDFHETLTRVGD